MMWIITKDHFPSEGAAPGTNGNAVGVTGPNWYSGAEAKCTQLFRMYDDDGILYYEGWASAIDFDPLDDFGEPNAGCTCIEFYNLEMGRWETL